jgi:Fur family iron response transcriptional regulator
MDSTDEKIDVKGKSPVASRLNPATCTRETVAGLLREHGVTPTHQRIEIAYALFSRCEHLSAERLLAIVNERYAETSKATVYNTLNLFVAKKLIREVIVDPARVFYDPNVMPHHHFYHVDSGELSDIDAGDVEIARLPALPPGMVNDGVDIIVRIRSARSVAG